MNDKCPTCGCPKTPAEGRAFKHCQECGELWNEPTPPPAAEPVVEEFSIPDTCGVSISQAGGNRVHLWVAYGKNQTASVELSQRSAVALTEALMRLTTIKVAHDAEVARLQADVCWYQTLNVIRSDRVRRLEGIVYGLARHIRNTDGINATKWGVEAMDLLTKVRELDPEKYDREVKAAALEAK